MFYMDGLKLQKGKVQTVVQEISIAPQARTTDVHHRIAQQPVYVSITSMANARTPPPPGGRPDECAPTEITQIRVIVALH
ncbi:hypothetical protein Q1695_009936 [Nippostrongylus brasiliensis]|nr:hypothetical protein Q1695_009936 [Nippostrongylus brasiliensis]